MFSTHTTDSVGHAYDLIADSYDHDWFGLYRGSTERVVEQIAAQCAARSPIEVADLAVGTGNALHALQARLELGDCLGLDVSTAMLAQAARKLPAETRLIHDTAANAERYIEPESIDLLLCHFMLRYLEPATVLPLARRLLKPGGYFSLATSTQNSLSETYTGRFAKLRRVSRMRKRLEDANNPRDHEATLDLISHYGLELVANEAYRQPVVFRSYDDVWAWAFESGWAAEFLGVRVRLHGALMRAAFKIAETTVRPFYPVGATSEISIVLARNP
jgi:ubiquinone/menaquinone biosynthesis C-methylase UbiE